jgi:membrane protein required for colicin V production
MAGRAPLGHDIGHEKTGDGVPAPGYTPGGSSPSPRQRHRLGFAGTMPITLLDIVLLVVMLVSGLLAMVRGFMREVLSITAWLLAAAATLYAYAKLLPFAKQYFNNDIVAAVAVVGGVFLVTLLVVSVLTVRISDMVLDSRVGALDRTLGFLFGLARGFFLVLIAFVFLNWLVDQKSQPKWITDAKSLTVLKTAGDSLRQMLPKNLDALYQKYKQRREQQEPQDSDPGRHGALVSPADKLAQAGYDPGGRIGMPGVVEALEVAR